MTTTIETYRQLADLGMPVPGRADVAVLRPWVISNGASIAGSTPAAGHTCVVLTGAFAGTSAWSGPPI